jgi:hypothetical protein
MITPNKFDQLKKFFTERRGDPNKLPDASIAIPVNAQGDLETVLTVLNDIAQYTGSHTFEVILAINNYPDGQEPQKSKSFVIWASLSHQPRACVVLPKPCVFLHG